VKQQQQQEEEEVLHMLCQRSHRLHCLAAASAAGLLWLSPDPFTAMQSTTV
jgi:hypothetical protein